MPPAASIAVVGYYTTISLKAKEVAEENHVVGISNILVDLGQLHKWEKLWIDVTQVFLNVHVGTLRIGENF